MNILSMLVRLQGTLGRTDLASQMVLLPSANSVCPQDTSEINLVVGYSNSPASQTALDLTLWIAHQTRLATGKQVTVQVVYVIDNGILNRIPVFDASRPTRGMSAVRFSDVSDDWCTSRSAIAELVKSPSENPQFGMTDLFEQADRILWNARCLAEEWRGSLKTHLRFGTVAKELKEVVQAESASLLILGCESNQHPLVKQLGVSLPCPVLGIPTTLHDE